MYSSIVSAIIPTVVPIGTESPAGTNWWTNPPTSASTSAVVFSVSSSKHRAAGGNVLPLGDEPAREQDVLGIGAELRHDHRVDGQGAIGYSAPATSTILPPCRSRCRSQASATRSRASVSTGSRIRPALAWPTRSA